MSIALPEPKLSGSHVLMGCMLLWKGTHMMLVNAAQKLRGRVKRFRTNNHVWAVLPDPVDELMTHGDANNEWISRPKPQYWEAFGILRLQLRHSCPTKISGERYLTGADYVCYPWKNVYR